VRRYSIEKVLLIVPIEIVKLLRVLNEFRYLNKLCQLAVLGGVGNNPV
jgi:hypothetical protein